MSFPPALLQWLSNCHPQLAAEATAAPAAPAKVGKAGKKAATAAPAASNPLLSFLSEWYTSKRLTVTENGRVHFTATSHDCKCDWPTIEAYINGKAYKKAVAKSAAAPFDIEPFRAYFGEHKRDPTKVYCHLTDQMLNKDAAELRRHMEGERFITARLARAKKLARRAERARARALNSAAAIAEDEDEDDEDDGAYGNPYEGAHAPVSDDDNDDEEEEAKSAKPAPKKGKPAFAAPAGKGKPAAVPAAKPAAAAASKAAAAKPAVKAAAAPATGAAALGAALFASLGKAGVPTKPAAAAGKGALKRGSVVAAAPIKRSNK